MSETREQAQRARKAFTRLSTQTDRSAVLRDIVDLLEKRTSAIIDANRKDLEAAKGALAPPLYKRLALNESKLREVIDGVRQVAAMADPVGHVLQETELDDGLHAVTERLLPARDKGLREQAADGFAAEQSKMAGTGGEAEDRVGIRRAEPLEVNGQLRGIEVVTGHGVAAGVSRLQRRRPGLERTHPAQRDFHGRQ